MGIGQVPTWNVPFPRNPFFTGREPIVAQVHSLLHAGKTAALSQPPAISGLGGIGKTQTAVEYAYRYREEYHYVLWVQANTSETLLANFVALASLLRLPEQDAPEQQIIVHALKQWLETHNNWLLIFDNADDLAILQDYLPAVNAGHILLTTRAQAMGGLARKIELDTMSPQEGATLLLRELKQSGQGDEVREESFRGVGLHPQHILVLLTVAIGILDRRLGLADASQAADGRRL